MLLLFLSAIGTLATDNSSSKQDGRLARFEERYRSAKSLSATFLEEYQENGRVTRKEAGTAYFLRPGKMRWDYEAPEKNVFLVDGKYAWFFTPADRTATRMPVKSSGDWRTPLALLTTNMKLSRVCSEVTPTQNEKPLATGDEVYLCLVRGSEAEQDSANREPFQEAYFEVSTDGTLSRIVIREQGGVRIEFRFENWHWNPPLEKALFQFRPPMGVAIVEGLLPDSPGARQ
jgi:outer membrane lipoprotein carrier protein